MPRRSEVQSFSPCPICNGSVSLHVGRMNSYRVRRLYSIGCDNSICPNFIGHAVAYDTLKRALHMWKLRRYDGHIRHQVQEDTYTLDIPFDNI